jgi:hypothetical protein
MVSSPVAQSSGSFTALEGALSCWTGCLFMASERIRSCFVQGPRVFHADVSCPVYLASWRAAEPVDAGEYANLPALGITS